MKRLITFLSVACFGLMAGQNITTPVASFDIIDITQSEKIQFYTVSISKANLESYRLKNKRDTLEFKNGFRLVLLSAKEMFLKGISVDINLYKESKDPLVPQPLFVVFENGWLGAEIQSTGKSNSK